MRGWGAISFPPDHYGEAEQVAREVVEELRSQVTA